MADLPQLQLESSFLLRVYLDQGLSVWALAEQRDAAGAQGRAEISALEGEILGSWTDAELREEAALGNWLELGFDEVGIEDAEDSEAHRRRRMAWRVIENAVSLAMTRAYADALSEPRPELRVYKRLPYLGKGSTRTTSSALVPKTRR